MSRVSFDARISDALARLCPDWDPHDVGQVDYLEGGYSNDNYALEYEGRRYVLRLPGLRQPYVDPRREADWYKALPGTVLTARPAAIDIETGEMLSPWLEGELLVDVWPGAADGEARADPGRLAQAASYLRHLHTSLPSAPTPYPLDDLVAELTADSPQPRSNTKSLAASEVPLRPCHNDLNPWNIIVGPEGWATLDWEMVGGNDPLFDVVNLYEGLCLPRAGLSDFALRYLGTSPDDLDRRLTRNLIAFWTRERGWAIFQRDRGNTRTEVLAQIETATAKLAELGAA